MSDFNPRGTFTALVTPFQRDPSQIDWPAYEKLVAAQVKGGITGLVPCGTTGESPTLSENEKRTLIETTRRVAQGKAQVLAGIGTNDTEKSAAQARSAEEAGADAVMLVMPSYSRPSQAGLIQHALQVARSTSLPVVLYNIPGRTCVNLTIDSLATILEQASNVVGLKDASGNVLYCQSAVARFGSRLGVLSGDDALTLPMMSVGARGVISVTSNVLPAEIVSLVSAMAEGSWEAARVQHLRLLVVHEAMFCGASPGPVKAALAHLGLVQDVLRSPMCSASEAERGQVLAALQAFRG